jgi:RND family efflux transporter MFP subunit
MVSEDSKYQIIHFIGADGPDQGATSADQLFLLGALMLRPGLIDRVAVVTLLPLVLLACSEAAPREEPPKPLVQTRTVSFGLDHIQRRYTGVLRARRDVDQAFRIGGKIVQRLVEVGDYVQAGQVLADLDPRDLDLQAGSAEAERAAAEAAVAQASADVERARTLNDRQFTSAAEYERRNLALEEARSRLERAERQLALVRNQRSDATLTASTAGIITAVMAEPGQVVALGTPVVRIAALEQPEIEVAIPEGQLDQLREAHATATLWASSGRIYRALLRELSPEADPASRTYLARFTLVDAGPEARLGMTATLALKNKAAQPMARLPLSAVVDQGTGPAVYVVTPPTNQLALKRVEVVRYDVNEAVISGGVLNGEQVVTLGVSRLSPDLAVRTAEAKGL